MYYIIKKNIVYIVFALSIIIFTTSVLYKTLTFYAQNKVEDLSKGMIRFHVVANSDTVEDQLLKQKVKDRVIDYMQPILKDSKSVEETRQKIRQNLNQMQAIAKETIEGSNKSYGVYCSLGEASFPTKAYGDVVFPAGTYEAFRIIIGEGKGENWWCVMFPPLCYVDAATGVVPLEGKQELEEHLNKEQLSVISGLNSNDYQIRFKIVDTINEKNRINREKEKQFP